MVSLYSCLWFQVILQGCVCVCVCVCIEGQRQNHEDVGFSAHTAQDSDSWKGPLGSRVSLMDSETHACTWKNPTLLANLEILNNVFTRYATFSCLTGPHKLWSQSWKGMPW